MQPLVLRAGGLGTKQPFTTLSKANTASDDKGNKHTLFHIYCLLWAMNFFSHEILNDLLVLPPSELSLDEIGLEMLLGQ